MKIRLGFVSNSSVSSFVCEICGRQEAGMDISMADFGFCECENGHTFCDEEKLECSEPINEDENEDYRNISEKYCPICQWKEISEVDFGKYLLKEYKIPRDEAFEQVKQLNKRRKKLYNGEYIMYVCSKLNLDRTKIIKELSEKYLEYKKYLEYIS
jgi:hypothetical protein